MMDGGIDPVALSKFKGLCQQAALLTKYDAQFSNLERKWVEDAKHFLEIALKNDDQRKADG
jgi:hypothetical protein